MILRRSKSSLSIHNNIPLDNKKSPTKTVMNIKGRGLMLGLEFDFEVKELRKKLIFKHKIFTGGSSNKNLLRILPPLNIKKKHIDMLYDALKIELS